MKIPWTEPKIVYREVLVERNVPLKLSDGTVLMNDIYRPQGGDDHPVLLIRDIYDKTLAQSIVFAHPSWYARHGYLVIAQDCRGRWKSQGDWYPLVNEGRDGAETIEWARNLPGSNGKVAMYGFSYCGATQLLAAAERPGGLATIMPALIGSDCYDGWTYRGGALHHAFTLSWALSLAQAQAHRAGDEGGEREATRELIRLEENFWRPAEEFLILKQWAPFYFDWLKHFTRDDYWTPLSIRDRYADFSIPALHIGGWYDTFLDGVIENFRGFQLNTDNSGNSLQQKLVIGPWYHMPCHQHPGMVDFGLEGRNCIDALQLLWLEHHVKGIHNQIVDEPPVAYFVMGENQWHFSDDWPPPNVRLTDFYLHSNGKANSLNGNGTISRQAPEREDPDVFIYLPNAPVLSLGGQSCCYPPVTPMGAFDQKSQEFRNDNLIFTSAILEEALMVAGEIEAILFASSSATDTDFTVKLVDVFPNDSAINICDGIIRARFRNSLSRPEPIVPGEIYQYRIKLGSTANLFSTGHQIRVEISSSNFPCFDRNFNDGGTHLNKNLTSMINATQMVFHDDRYPSRIILPVI